MLFTPTRTEPLPGPCTPPTDVRTKRTPSLVSLTLRALCSYPDQVRLPVRLPLRNGRILDELVEDPACVDPRLWATLVQVYDGLPAYLSAIALPLSDPHLPLLQRIESTGLFSLVTILDLGSCGQLTDETAMQLRFLHSLTAFDASWTTISGYALRTLAATLQVGDGQGHRGPWALRVLSLRNCRAMENEGLEALAAFPLLSAIDLRGTRCRPHLLKSFPFSPSPVPGLLHPTSLPHSLHALHALQPRLYSSPNPFFISLYHTPTKPTRPVPIPIPVTPQDAFVFIPANHTAPIKIGNSLLLEKQQQALDDARRKDAWYHNQDSVLRPRVPSTSAYIPPSQSPYPNKMALHPMPRSSLPRSRHSAPRLPPHRTLHPPSMSNATTTNTYVSPAMTPSTPHTNSNNSLPNTSANPLSRSLKLSAPNHIPNPLPPSAPDLFSSDPSSGAKHPLNVLSASTPTPYSPIPRVQSEPRHMHNHVPEKGGESDVSNDDDDETNHPLKLYRAPPPWSALEEALSVRRAEERDRDRRLGLGPPSEDTDGKHTGRQGTGTKPKQGELPMVDHTSERAARVKRELEAVVQAAAVGKRRKLEFDSSPFVDANTSANANPTRTRSSSSTASSHASSSSGLGTMVPLPLVNESTSRNPFRRKRARGLVGSGGVPDATASPYPSNSASWTSAPTTPSTMTTNASTLTRSGHNSKLKDVDDDVTEYDDHKTNDKNVTAKNYDKTKLNVHDGYNVRCDDAVTLNDSMGYEMNATTTGKSKPMIPISAVKVPLLPVKVREDALKRERRESGGGGASGSGSSSSAKSTKKTGQEQEGRGFDWKSWGNKPA